MSPAHAAGTIIDGRYEIAALLGSGGFAHVYRAHDRLLGTDVALKILRNERTDESSLIRFRREVTLARRVSSEHVVRIFDFGETVDGTYLTMELVEGGSLRDLTHDGALPIAEALRISRSILRGLAALHAEGIVHRDVKPGNVLIAENGAIKIADLGVARAPLANDVRATRTDAVVGTLEYVSPDEVVGRPLDPRSDLFSFGVLLYECLTGKLPYGERSSIGAVLSHLREKPIPPRSIRPEIPRWLERLVLRLLEPKPERRFASAGIVLDLIERETSPLEWRRILFPVAVFALLFGGVAAARSWQSQTLAPARVTSQVDGTIVAVDAEGEVLWRKPGMKKYLPLVAREGGEIDSVLLLPLEISGAENEALILAARSGRESGRINIGSPSAFFRNLDDRYTPTNFLAADIDGDGSEELIAGYVHTYYPSGIFLFDLKQAKSDLVFVGGGHHRAAAVTDVNGDGKSDLIITGIANKLGWYHAVGALDLSGRYPLGTAGQPSQSPDFTQPVSGNGLLWYALLPAGYMTTGSVRVNERDRLIQLTYPDSSVVSIDFDGFRNDAASPLPKATRQDRRKAVFAGLALAQRMSALGQHPDAVAEIDRVSSTVGDLGDPTLQEWVGRVRGRILLQAGFVADAERQFESLSGGASETDIAFDAARALHLAGHLEEAVRWYRKGLFKRRDLQGGRLLYEYAEGALLALGERRRFAEMEDLIDAYALIEPGNTFLQPYRNYIAWLRGDTHFGDAGKVTEGTTDLPRYWALEQRYASGSRNGLADAVAAEERRGGSLTPLVRSLRAQLAADDGDFATARALIADANRWTEENRSQDVIARSHAWLVAERMKRIDSMARKSASR